MYDGVCLFHCGRLLRIGKESLAECTTHSPWGHSFDHVSCEFPALLPVAVGYSRMLHNQFLLSLEVVKWRYRKLMKLVSPPIQNIMRLIG